jgi:hypothetical protein
MILDVYRKVKKVVLEKFSDLVLNTEVVYSPAGRARKLRINLLDGSYIDVWYSHKKDYSYHWERRSINHRVFRHDNAPHQKWKKVRTFPKHFHNGSNSNVVESNISSDPAVAIEQFMAFVRETIRSKPKTFQAKEVGH